jgi:hypothetical protein
MMPYASRAVKAPTSHSAFGLGQFSDDVVHFLIFGLGYLGGASVLILACKLNYYYLTSSTSLCFPLFLL